MNNTINIRDAKNDLSRVIQAVSGGQEVVVTNRNKPVAKIVPFTGKAVRNLERFNNHSFTMPADFNDPMELFED